MTETPVPNSLGGDTGCKGEYCTYFSCFKNDVRRPFTLGYLQVHASEPVSMLRSSVRKWRAHKKVVGMKEVLPAKRSARVTLIVFPPAGSGTSSSIEPLCNIRYLHEDIQSIPEMYSLSKVISQSQSYASNDDQVRRRRSPRRHRVKWLRAASRIGSEVFAHGRLFHQKIQAKVA